MRRLAELLSPLRNGQFTLVWLGQSVSQMGDQVFMIALVWLLVGLTGSSLLMGAVLSASYIPTLLLLLFGGAIADRYSRRGIALLSDGLRALVTAAFAALVTLNLITVPEVFVFSAFYGLVGAFFNPALVALYPSLVTPKQYDAATSLRQITTQAAALAGPALGGLLIAQWSVGAALIFDAASFVVSFIALALMRRRSAAGAAPQTAEQANPAEQPGRVSRWGEMFAGLRFLRGEPAIFMLILFFSLTNGLNDVEAVLVPRLVRLDLHLSATAFGLMAACMGIGGLLGAFMAGMTSARLRWRAQIIVGSMLLFGGAIILMGLAQNALTLDLAYAALGVTFAVPEVLSGALLQRVIPLQMMGRVVSFISLIAMAMNPAGLFLAGWLGDTLGVRAGLWIGGGAIAGLAALMLFTPAVRTLNQLGIVAEPAPALATVED
ncbi:MAG TPA: MFS transporter [Ktedonobacterales bacterium]